MFSQRWSTFTLISLVLATGLSAFYGERHSMASHARALAAPVVPVLEKQPAPIISTPPTEAANPGPQLQTENLEARCRELFGRPGTPAGEQELADLIEKMAESDPQRAIALAAAQSNLRLRAALLRAALRGWGTADPEAAATWVKSETVMDQAQAINALLQGAVHDPDKAAGVAATLIQNDPSRAAEFGGDLISALTEAGQFERAANFAANGASANREDWLLPAYSRWAEFQPQAAFANAMQITDPGARDSALNAIIVGWSPTDPKALVEFAKANLPEGQQGAALASAIGFWADSDPVAAATWINQNDPVSASDPGVAKIALSPQLTQEPELAASWAENIFNPQLRLETLTSVIDKWKGTDLSGAENYVENSPALGPEDRTQLLAELKNQSAP